MDDDFQIGMGNPAEEYCLERGGDVICTSKPGQPDVCICRWPDGYECDLWEYFRGQCEPAPRKATAISEDMVMLMLTGLGIVSLVLLNRTGKK